MRSDEAPSPPKRRVLIIDDDATIRAGLARLISLHGHEPITAGSVQEGLALLDAGASHVLLDMNLPDGVGTTILRRVREANLPIKVAVLSGSLDVHLLSEAEALGPDALFVKPPDWDSVLEWVGGE